MATITRVTAAPPRGAYTAGQLPKWTPWAVLAGSVVVAAATVWLLGAASGEESFNAWGAGALAAVLYGVLVVVLSRIVEGPRKARDRLATTLVTGAFLIALIPLISLIVTVIARGMARFDLEFFTWSMRNVVGAGGGAIHAIVGTLEMTLTATLISVPIGLMASIYLVEYGRGTLARLITFFVDVMTGIPSIVAGLFAYSMFALIYGPGVKTGLAGSIALSVIMIPIVVRSSEDMLRLVPHELREASYALGVPKWRTIVKVVLPTSIAGIMTGVTLAIARVIGETAPLLIAAGFTNNLNYSLTDGRMQSLPVFVYNQYVSQGSDAQAYIDRAWAGALTLILIVMVLNLVARLIARFFAPKTGR